MIDPKKKLNLKTQINQISFTVLPADIKVVASQKQTILQAMLDANIEIDHSCGGMGSCGTCRVIVVSGLNQLGPRSESEKEMAEERQFSADERLSCQSHVTSGLVLKRPS